MCLAALEGGSEKPALVLYLVIFLTFEFLMVISACTLTVGEVITGNLSPLQGVSDAQVKTAGVEG